ncbi:MAG: bifunctional 2-polyprenyl-6-hydroxyphenol methylase/3-demethylubiquinol 3-O-methyltransferase UbiG [Methylocapsa sp.]|nr:bifunctional 2-polyprenyl-6-hydroxyphenol methylase/3-demethylubiquinol 3-O-methyltransferase UbiG [Methylocapsa sp.]
MAGQDTLGHDSSVHKAEVDRFGRLGAQWWDPEGPMRALHKLNPVRVAYLRELLARHIPLDGRARDWRAALPLQGLSILDIGCGAGILSEPLARLGALLTSIDPSVRNIEIAKGHAARANLVIDYRCMTAKALADGGSTFDAVLAMEVIEHVRHLPGFLQQAAKMVRPGGMLVAATLNRTLKSFALAILCAEYVLHWVPQGTHDWNHFVTPQRLAAGLRAAGLHVTGKTGVVYDIVARKWRLSHDTDVNYMLAAIRAKEENRTGTQ